MAYVAPIIYDRVATGDNIYTMQQLSDGKVSLTPSPNEVLNAGTDINKALLQPIVDALQKLNTDILPKFALTYWYRRTVSGQYGMRESNAWDNSANYEQRSGYSGVWGNVYVKYIYIFRTGYYETEYESTTLQYSSTISVNTSDGTITLNSATTKTFHKSSDTNDSIRNTLKGKYVKGLHPNEDMVFYIPQDSYIGNMTWQMDDGIFMTYDGYYNGEHPPHSSEFTEDIKQITTAYNETTGEWELVSSLDPEQYPGTSTSNGYEWLKIGRIDENVLTTSLYQPKTINFTSANFSGNVYEVNIEAPRFAYAVLFNQTYTYYRSDYILGIGCRIANTGMSIAWNNDSENARYNWFTLAQAFASPSANFPVNVDTPSTTPTIVKIVSTGIRINCQGLNQYRHGVLMYMPI